MALAAEIRTFENERLTSARTFDRPVDLVHLARFTLGNRSLEREVLQLFHAQSLNYLKRLKDARMDKDWADAAHTIKGSARGIGAWRLARCAESAETLSGSERKACSVQAVRELETLIGETNGYIESLLVEVEDTVV